jgi:hypothetical protein
MFKDLTGKKFNRLTVIKRVENNKHGQARWECECDCGNKATVITGELNSGGTKSCGCYFRERAKEANTKHDLSRTELYKSWGRMISRCTCTTNSKYKFYGGKGISVCDEWRNDFKTFYDWSMSNNYSKELSIDRIDPIGNYEPNNCRWTNNLVQSINKGMHTRNTSGFKGVSYKKSLNKWQVNISVNKKDIYLGVYANIEDAVAARNAAEDKYFKPILDAATNNSLIK